MTFEVASARIRAEFDEMPGMTLTARQASKLFGLEETFCQRVVEQLVVSAYLRRTERGAYARVAA